MLNLKVFSCKCLSGKTTSYPARVSNIQSDGLFFRFIHITVLDPYVTPRCSLELGNMNFDDEMFCFCFVFLSIRGNRHYSSFLIVPANISFSLSKPCSHCWVFSMKSQLCISSWWCKDEILPTCNYKNCCDNNKSRNKSDT